MARPAIVLTAVLLTLVVALPSQAEAYVVSGQSWPATTITYRANGKRAAAAARFAARAWNRSGAGVRFRRVQSGRADVTVKIGGSWCGGWATVGSTPWAGVWVGRCNRRIQAMAATHEFGHVMGLGHENRRCAVMNPFLRPETGTPVYCRIRPQSYWVRHPLQRDDLRGARAIAVALKQRSQLDAAPR